MNELANTIQTFEKKFDLMYTVTEDIISDYKNGLLITK